jgi:thiamine biosynthesis lipoprotein
MKTSKLVIFTLLPVFLILSSCQASVVEVKGSEFLLDTIVELTLYGRNHDTQNMLDEIFGMIKDYEQKYSRYIPESEIAAINSNPHREIVVSEDTMEMLEKSLHFSAISDGLFDISIGTLVDLWDINGDNPHVPSAGDIASALERVDYRKIILNQARNTVMLSVDGMKLDTGAVAKGFITDKLVSFLQEKEVESALLNLGGNLYLLGSKTDGSAWKIGIRNPYGLQGEYLGTVSVRNMSIVTSGIYERFFEENQEIYHHILNPKTGYPENNQLASVSILSPSSLLADGFSTTVFLLGLEAGMDLVEKTEHVEAIMITRDKTVHISQGIKNGDIPFQVTNNEFTVME